MSSSMNATQGNQIDLVFAMDATGSMSQYIRAAKNAIAGINAKIQQGVRGSARLLGTTEF